MFAASAKVILFDSMSCLIPSKVCLTFSFSSGLAFGSTFRTMWLARIWVPLIMSLFFSANFFSSASVPLALMYAIQRSRVANSLRRSAIEVLLSARAVGRSRPSAFKSCSTLATASSIFCSGTGSFWRLMNWFTNRLLTSVSMASR